LGTRWQAQWLRPLVVSATVAVGAVVVLASSTTRAGTSLALLEPVAQTVSMRHAEAAFVEVRAAVVLQPGDTVRTDDNGRAVVTYADGTGLVLEPNTEVVIEDIQDGPDPFVLITQNAGRVWYELSRTLSPNARYEVRSGALAAVVRAGSTVEVNVAPDGTTSVTAAQGSAETSAGGETVTVTQGTKTTATNGQPPMPLVDSNAQPPASSTPMAPPSAATPTATQTPTFVMPLPSVPAAGATKRTPAPTATQKPAQPTPTPTPWPMPIDAPSLPPIPGTTDPAKLHVDPQPGRGNDDDHGHGR